MYTVIEGVSLKDLSLHDWKVDLLFSIYNFRIAEIERSMWLA